MMTNNISTSNYVHFFQQNQEGYQ